MGYGAVVKLNFQFKNQFWEEETLTKFSDAFFIFSDAAIPTWWTQEPDKHAMLSGWVAGPAAEKIKKMDDEVILQKAITSLSAIFKMKPAELKRRIIASYVFNWLNDPFARGAYAWKSVGSTLQRRELQKPVDNRLFFAGEALYQGSEMGTVEAALASGEQAAKEVLARAEL